MWSLAITLTTLLAVTPAVAKKPSHTTKPCPTVTSTTSVCSTCITPACISLSTVTSQKGCPTHVPTVKTSFPCSKSQCPGGCATSYVFPSSYGITTTKPVCPTVTKTATVCSECITLACLSLSTVSSVCGCPKKPATVTTAFPCGEECPTGCGTEVVSATVTPNCKKGGKHEDDD
ncbi:gelatinase b [Fusarium heterosporum]|uniref:Gelatinase b n=1 Tax=Fusarium heterosporum TaxID=42747 RepID=A0A8H5TB83_FUSHE|nr:gelatinase b [Fusarium heterosporum]